MKEANKAELKKIRELMRDKKARDKSGLFVAEGLKIVKDLVRKSHVPESVIISRKFAVKGENKGLLDELENKNIPLFETQESDFDKLSSLQHPQGIMAVMKKSDFSKDVPIGDKDLFLVLCDGIQDPGNLGTIIRSSVAFGADSVLLAGEAVDIYNPKVIRASSGIVFDIPICRCDMSEIDSLKKEGYRLLIGQPMQGKSRDIAKIKGLSGKLVIAFGSEGRGVSREVRDRADDFFYIPTRKQVESLNVTAAAAISLYVFARGEG